MSDEVKPATNTLVDSLRGGGTYVQGAIVDQLIARIDQERERAEAMEKNAVHWQAEHLILLGALDCAEEVDSYCRNHGKCSWCRSNRTHAAKRQAWNAGLPKEPVDANG